MRFDPKVIVSLLFASVWLAPCASDAKTLRCPHFFAVESVATVASELSGVAAASEAAAMRTLERIVDLGNKRAGGDRDAGYEEVVRWLEQLERTLSAEERPSAMAHAALMHLLRSRFFESFDDPSLVLRAEAALEASWTRFAGNQKSVAHVLEVPLPYAALMRASRDERLFMEAVLNSPNLRASRESGLGIAFQRSAMVQAMNFYAFRLGDSAIVATLTALAFSQTGSQVLAGLAIGGAIGVVHENLTHRVIGHMAGRVRRAFRGMGAFGRFFLRIADSHQAIHHGQLEDYFDVDSIDRDRVAQHVLPRLHSGLTLETLDEQGMGRRIEARATLNMMLSILPLSLATAYILGLDPIGIIAAGGASVAYLPHLNLFHGEPLIHATRTRVAQGANPLVRWIANTRYFASLTRHHYGHHENPSTANFSVIFPPWVDIVFGTYHRLTVDELMEMRRRDGFY